MLTTQQNLKKKDNHQFFKSNKRLKLITWKTHKAQSIVGLDHEFKYFLGIQDLSCHIPLLQDVPDKIIIPNIKNVSLEHRIVTEFNSNTQWFKNFLSSPFKNLATLPGIFLSTYLYRKINQNPYKKLFFIGSFISLLSTILEKLFRKQIELKKILDQEAIELNLIFDQIEKELERADKKDAIFIYEKLISLRRKYRILLNKDSPNHPESKWRYACLFGLCIQKFRKVGVPLEFSYLSAIRFSRTTDEYFFALKNFINEFSTFREFWIRTRFSDYGPNDPYRHSERYCLKFFVQKEINEYMSLLPTDPGVYQADLEYLRKTLHACEYALSEGKALEASEIFTQIPWGYFFEKTYPGMAIKYYQIKASLSLGDELYDYKLLGDSILRIQDRRLLVAYHSLRKAQALIDQHYPEFSAIHQEYLDSYKKFIKAVTVFNIQEESPQRTMLYLATARQPSQFEIDHPQVSEDTVGFFDQNFSDIEMELKF